MCRHLAYLGSPTRLGDLIDAPHGLAAQGQRPAEMVVANENPDGWGIAWWADTNPEPEQYRATVEIWLDTEFAKRDALGTAALGAVRKASPGTTRQTVNNAPFLADTPVGAVAFSLNGFAFRDPQVETRLRATVPPTTRLVGDTDSEVLFALLRQHLDRGETLSNALAAVHATVAPGSDEFLNMLAVTEHQIVATTWHHTLYARRTNDATTVASEPLDDGPGWQRIPDAHLVVADHESLTTVPLEGLR